VEFSSQSAYVEPDADFIYLAGKFLVEFIGILFTEPYFYFVIFFVFVLGMNIYLDYKIAALTRPTRKENGTEY
jgi:hypothetical protein